MPIAMPTTSIRSLPLPTVCDQLSVLTDMPEAEAAASNVICAPAGSTAKRQKARATRQAARASMRNLPLLVGIAAAPVQPFARQTERDRRFGHPSVHAK